MNSVCRICRADGGNVKMYALKPPQIKIFELLANLKFKSRGRSAVVCVFCQKHLQRCSTLSDIAKKSEKIFKIKTTLKIKNKNNFLASHEPIERLQRSKVQHISMGPLKLISLYDGSVQIETMEEPQETENAVCVDNDMVEPNHSSARPTETNTQNSETAEQSANSIESMKRYVCDICTKTFSSRTIFASHVRTHELRKLYCCDMCKKIMKTRSSIVAHIKGHNQKSKK